MACSALKVLVTDGNTRAALAVARSLGRRGHVVLVAETGHDALAAKSKYCADSVTCPDPASDERGYLEALSDAVERHRVDVLLPVADIATMTVAAAQERFRGVRIPCAASPVIERAADKVDVLRTAMRLGVAVPLSRIVERLEDVGPEIGQGIPFPIVVKPHRSRLRTPAGWKSSAVSYAADDIELLNDLRARPDYEYPVILQERITGEGMGIFVCYRRGELTALFAHRRVREKPPWGGVSVLSESVLPHPIARASALRLLEEIGWEGVGMVEFKADPRDGLPKLMEINGRFWGSLQLAIDAGVDFPAILLDDASPVPAPGEYQTGVRCRWFWGDVDALVQGLRSRSRARWPDKESRIRLLVSFSQLWDRNLFYDNPKSDDLAPWLYETWQWIKR